MPGTRPGMMTRRRRQQLIKVWGRNTSSNVQKVMWAVEEIGLPHERIDIGGPFGKNRESAYLAMNPNGLVPTLEEDDGFLLWESNAIVRYLAAKHRAQMLEPADLHARAQANAWMDWQLSVLGPAMGAGQCLDGLAAFGAWTGDHAVFRGHGPHAA
jgi:glutathione S-transferase